VTFTTRDRFVLSPHERTLVIQSCLRKNGVMYYLHVVMVMPDHVHMLFTPRRDEAGWPYALPDVTRHVKGFAAHAINNNGRKGRVWQQESFDHVLRSGESLREKIEYTVANPVRAGVVNTASEYDWTWEEQVPIV
jgi:REP element-mobilizing transposase RayT